jgi:hypothetical protein
MTGARRQDVESIEAIVTALYETISGPAGPRDWDRERFLLYPGAHLMPTRPREDGSHGVEVFDAEGYITSRTPYFAADSFHEVEIARRVDRFGNIAHVWSTYEGRRTPEGEILFRGINSIQLYNDGDRWWVMAVLWDNERPGNALPAEYGG